MFSKSGKHFANPAVGRMHDRGSAPEHSKESMKGGPANDPQKQGDTNEATTPHPVTGVHKVEIAHHAGHISVKVHHDGGAVEHTKHGSLDEAHAHAQQMLSADAAVGGDQQAPPTGGMESADSLGGMMGGGSY